MWKYKTAREQRVTADCVVSLWGKRKIQLRPDSLGRYVHKVKEQGRQKKIAFESVAESLKKDKPFLPVAFNRCFHENAKEKLSVL